jgi:hypothetical protein
MVKRLNVRSISIRNKKLNYYVITYFWNEKENVYFIVSTSEAIALAYFLTESISTNIVLKKEDILNIKEIEIMHPN